MAIPREDSGRSGILLATPAGLIRSVEKAVQHRLCLWIDRNGAVAEALHVPAMTLAAVPNGRGRRLRGRAVASGVPTARMEPALHPGDRYVFPANCENVNHAA